MKPSISALFILLYEYLFYLCRDVIKQAKSEAALIKRHTILFLDEVHRFNKAQQDAFLPHIEAGVITFIGATTENPSFRKLKCKKLSFIQCCGSGSARMGNRVQ
jgi:hypothetical protein